MKLAKMIFSVVAAISMAVTAFAQTNVATGSVYGDNDEALVGVSVIVKGTMNGASTDANGTFSIPNVSNGSVLSIECLGYQPLEIVFNGKPVKVILKSDSEYLDQVIVVGYGVQKKSDVTGAISSVKSDVLANRSVNDVTSAMQGKVAGMQVVSTSAIPGSIGQIRLRGLATNDADSSQPLYIVDGILANDLSIIDPQDIDSIEILKDGASAAIYGAQAGNGVVLVTTKKGVKGRSRISYDGSYTIEKLGFAPTMMNAEEYIDAMTVQSTRLSRTTIDKYWDGKTDTNWIEETLSGGYAQRHKITLDGASDKASYYTSVSYLDNDGIVTGDYDTYKKLNVQLNAEYQLTKWLTVGTNNTFSRSKSKSTEYLSGSQECAFSSIFALDPLSPFTYSSPDQMPESFYNAYMSGKDLLMYEGGWLSNNRDYTSKKCGYGHPLVNMLAYDKMVIRSNYLSGNTHLNLHPVKGLVFTSKFGYRFGYSNSGAAQKAYWYNSDSKFNLNSTIKVNLDYQWDNFVNYSHTFGTKHNFEAMAGMSFVKETSDYLQTSVDKLSGYAQNYYFIDFVSSDASTSKKIYGREADYASLSYFGRLGYNYDNRYYIQASFRADAFDESYLPLQNRWGYFPSISVGWNITNEPFMASVDKSAVSLLKLRASWGTNGNINILKSKWLYINDINTSRTAYQLNGNADILQGAGPRVSEPLANNDIKWETSKQFDLGLDASFLSNRLTATFDYYNKLTEGLLVEAPIAATSGFSTTIVNGGDVINKGFELELGWKDRIGDFSYGISGNIAHNSNVLTKINNESGYINGEEFYGDYFATRIEADKPLWYFYGYKYEGVDSETGKPIYQDLDENGLDEEDKMMIGNPAPDFTYGITLTAEYKGLDLTVFGSGSHGNDIWYGNFNVNYKNNNFPKYIYDNLWKEAGDNSLFPKAANMINDTFFQSSGVVADGSYFRINQIQLGYTLPQSLISKVKISNLRFYVSLDNYFTFTKYFGFDPATAACNTGCGNGIDRGTYPTPKRAMFGVNLSF